MCESEFNKLSPKKMIETQSYQMAEYRFQDSESTHHIAPLLGKHPLALALKKVHCTGLES